MYLLHLLIKAVDGFRQIFHRLAISFCSDCAFPTGLTGILSTYAIFNERRLINALHSRLKWTSCADRSYAGKYFITCFAHLFKTNKRNRIKGTNLIIRSSYSSCTASEMISPPKLRIPNPEVIPNSTPKWFLEPWNGILGIQWFTARKLSEWTQSPTAVVYRGFKSNKNV